MANANTIRWSGRTEQQQASRGLEFEDGSENMANPNSKQAIKATVTREECNPWPVEPHVGRVAHGVPHRVDRLRGLGNAVLPQKAEWLGRQILASHFQEENTQ